MVAVVVVLALIGRSTLRGRSLRVATWTAGTEVASLTLVLVATAVLGLHGWPWRSLRAPLAGTR